MTIPAQQHTERKEIMPTTARSRELELLSPDIRERAFFSATVDKADILQRAKDLTIRMLNPDADGPGMKIGKAGFREGMRQLLGSMGYALTPDGLLTDITSTKRLNLIATMNTQEAQAYGQFTGAQQPAVLSAFPAQELFRLQSRKEPRDWMERWVASGGRLYAGRMIAMKDSPVWSGISAFGRPYPPFDFNSGMWTRGITRGEAVRLGVCEPDDVPAPDPRTYNADVQQACKPLSTGLHAALKERLGNAVRIDADGVVHLLPGGAS